MNEKCSYLYKFRLNLFLARVWIQKEGAPAPEPKTWRMKSKTDLKWEHFTQKAITLIGNKFHAPMFLSNAKNANVECELFKFDAVLLFFILFISLWECSLKISIPVFSLLREVVRVSLYCVYINIYVCMRPKHYRSRNILAEAHTEKLPY